MKIILLSLMMAIVAHGFSQEATITVSAQNRSVSAVPGEENEGKVLALQRSITSTDACLVAKVTNEEINENWKRNFIIYDGEDKEIDSLIATKQNSYKTPLKTLLPNLQQGREYSLYTIILPIDPQKAMEVKVARQLVCKINVVD